MKKAPSPLTVKSAFQDQNKHIDSTKQARFYSIDNLLNFLIFLLAVLVGSIVGGLI